LAIIAGSIALLAATPASAFVRSYTTRGCNPVHWAQTCVFVTTDSTELTSTQEMSLADRERIAAAAIQSWQAHSQGFLQLKYVAASGPREVASDGVQVIKVRTDSWCRPPDDAGGDPICYDPAATALTTLTYVNDAADPANDGRITDADIELNAVANYFYDADADPNPRPETRRPMDLWNTLSHELGHLQGLDHTCRRSATDLPSCARDSNGEEVIACSTVEAGRATSAELESIFETTMYPSTSSEEIGKRTPEADDLDGIDEVYPPRDDPKVCQSFGDAGPVATDAPASTPATGRGCSAAPHASIAMGWAPCAALVAYVLARRRRRSRSNSPH
jgi:hypothetical protein